MKTQTIKSVEQDIQLYKYWIEQCKKVLRVAKEFGLSENEIKQNGTSIKRLRLKLKQKKTILNNIKKVQLLTGLFLCILKCDYLPSGLSLLKETDPAKS